MGTRVPTLALSAVPGSQCIFSTRLYTFQRFSRRKMRTGSYTVLCIALQRAKHSIPPSQLSDVITSVCHELA